MNIFLSFIVFIIVSCSTTTKYSPHSWVEISEGQFQKNIETLKQTVGPRVKICAVMKADGYGHGLNLLMTTLIKKQIPCIGITSNEEAVTVRKSGYTGILMRLRTATVVEMLEAQPLHVEELIGNLELATIFNSKLESIPANVNFHLALNSAGMSRNGIDLKNSNGKSDVLALIALSHLKIVGIMTHFPVEEKNDVKKGLKQFIEDSNWVITDGKLSREQITLHAANSFATLEVPEARLDMVRVGGALFGDTLPTHKEFRPIITFKSTVAGIFSFPKGSTVNYDRTYTLTRDSKLANIPVGYSDGLRRIFSNKAKVLIRGKAFPIVGRVTMNTIMVDVTDGPEINIDDEVVLFGHQKQAAITQQDVEKWGETIFADLYTMWGAANPKILVP